MKTRLDDGVMSCDGVRGALAQQSQRHLSAYLSDKRAIVCKWAAFERFQQMGATLNRLIMIVHQT